MASLNKIAQIAMRPGYWRAALHGVAPTVEHAAALKNCRFDTVIDVGANKGQFAWFALRQWPQAEILCFEPLPGPRAKLTRLLGDRVAVYDCALGASAGDVVMHVATRVDSSSLLPLGDGQKRFYHMEEAARVLVRIERLDSALTRAQVAHGLLKIDVQGFEYEVLRGAEALLDDIDAIYVECSFIELYKGQHLGSDVAALLRNAGFEEVGRFNEDCRDGQLVQADLLFVRSGREHSG